MYSIVLSGKRDDVLKELTKIMGACRTAYFRVGGATRDDDLLITLAEHQSPYISLASPEFTPAQVAHSMRADAEQIVMLRDYLSEMGEVNQC